MRKIKLIVGLLVAAMIIQMLPLSANRVDAEVKKLIYNIVIYTAEPQQTIVVNEFVGFEEYSIEFTDSEFTHTVLNNGIHKYQTISEYELNEPNEYSPGDFVSYSLNGLNPERVRTEVFEDSEGNLAVNIVLQQKNIGEKLYPLEIKDEQGQPIQGLGNIRLPIMVNDQATSLRVIAKQGVATPYEVGMGLKVDDNGEFLPVVLTENPATLNTELAVGNKTYLWKNITITDTEDERKIEAVLAEPHFVTKTVTANFTAPANINLTNNSNFTFLVGNKEYANIRPLNITNQGDQLQISFTLNNIIDEAGIKLKNLPSEAPPYYSIAEQNYLEDSKILNVKIGRKIGLNLSKINNVAYDRFAVDHQTAGVTLSLYDLQDNLLQDSKTGTGINPFQRKIIWFDGVTPGEYKIKIKSMPNGERYDLTKEYRLLIDANFNPTLGVFDGENFIYQNPYGSANVPGIPGYKTPFLILVNKKPELSKNIEAVKTTTETDFAALPAGTKQLGINKGDEVEFKITAILSGDHNVNIKFGHDVDMLVKRPIVFEDVLAEELQFIDGSVRLLLDGRETVAYEAIFDEATRTLTIKDNDNSVVNFDFNQAINLPADKTLTVLFKAKIKESADLNAPILNTVGEETVALIPNISLKVKKEWVGGPSLVDDIKADSNQYLQNFVLDVYKGQDKVETLEILPYLVNDSLVIEDNGNFSFKLEHLPLYSAEELQKPDIASRIVNTYKLREEINPNIADYQPVLSEVTVDKEPMIVCQNVYQAPVASFILHKTWQLLPDSKIQSSAEVLPKFILQMISADGKKTELWFDKEQGFLKTADNNDFSYQRRIVENGQIVNKDQKVTVTVLNDDYTLADLPVKDENGNSYTYKLQETEVKYQGKIINSQFEFEHNDDDPVWDNNTDTYSKTINNKEIPPVNPSKPPVKPKPSNPSNPSDPSNPLNPTNPTNPTNPSNPLIDVPTPNENIIFSTTTVTIESSKSNIPKTGETGRTGVYVISICICMALGVLIALKASTKIGKNQYSSLK